MRTQLHRFVRETLVVTGECTLGCLHIVGPVASWAHHHPAIFSTWCFDNCRVVTSKPVCFVPYWLFEVRWIGKSSRLQLLSILPEPDVLGVPDVLRVSSANGAFMTRSIFLLLCSLENLNHMEDSTDKWRYPILSLYSPVLTILNARSISDFCCSNTDFFFWMKSSSWDDL